MISTSATAILGRGRAVVLLANSSGSKRFLSRGGFSRMMDMGGSPAAATSLNKSSIPNTSKNSKIQAVAFDFELLCHNIHGEADTVKADPTKIGGSGAGAGDNLSSSSSSEKQVQPNVDKVKEFANLLNVDLGTPERNKKPSSPQEDDLSLLEQQISPKAKPEQDKTIQRPSETTTYKPPGQDIRAKYAGKLHKKGIDGGVSGLELAKYQIEDTLKKGDAAGHLNARKIAASQVQGTKWMSLTGTGKLLQTLTHRSIKIALIPRQKKAPHADPLGLNDDQSPQQLMEDLKNQLRDVEFNVLVEQTSDDSPNGIEKMVKQALEGLGVEPKVILFVSDQDASLRVAKDLGMATCRIRPPNTRRGNVSAHYTVKDIFGVQDVVNEMNGISFNAVLNSL